MTRPRRYIPLSAYARREGITLNAARQRYKRDAQRPEQDREFEARKVVRIVKKRAVVIEIRKRGDE